MAKKKKSKKIWVIIVIILIIAGAGYFYFKPKAPKQAPQKTSFTVKKETFENIIEISGNISAAQSQSLQAAGSGTVQKVYVKEGDIVKKGELILELDVAEQEFNLASLDFDIAQKKMNGSKREIELLEKKRAMLVQKLDDRKIVAYFDGIIASLDVSAGDYIAAKDEVGMLINRSYMTASVEIVETDVAKLRKNQPVHFTFPAFSKKTIDGYVTTYPAIGTITQRGATVVKAEVRIDNPPDEILPNYSFTGKIDITEPVTVTLVENGAIGRKDDKFYAEVMHKDGSTTEVFVEVDPYDTNFVSVISGLNAGDVVKNLTGTQSGMNKDSFSPQMGGNRANGGGGQNPQMGRF